MAPPVTRDFREIPLGRIVPPELASRATMDETKLEELARDISRNGVLQPLLVATAGDRYEIVAGHRRYLAAGRAGLVAVPCLVYPTKDTALEGLKYAENRHREDLNPAEEALWFSELLERDCGGDVDVLCEQLGEKRAYVEGRLALFTGDPRVFEALQRGVIGIGVAHALNVVTDTLMRRYFLDAAVRGGATRTIVEGWIAQWRQSTTPASGESPAPAATEPLPGAAPDALFRCACCDKTDNVHLMRPIYVHQYCQLAILDRLLEAYKSGSPA